MAATVQRLPPLPPISEIIRIYHLSASRGLSQNFLLNMDLCRKFARSAGSLVGAHVVEVGPGPGGITRALLEQNIERLVVVEKDRRFVPGLDLLADVSRKRMSVVRGDVLEYDFTTAFPSEMSMNWYDESPNLFIFGNLPFNIATPLIIRLLRAMSIRNGPFVFGRTTLTLTFQKEVGERMIAPIGGHQRCRLSVMAQYLADVKMKFLMPGSCFVPSPKVDVSCMQLTPLKEPYIKLHFDLVEKFCRHLFHYRQKYCITSLKTLFPDDVAKDFAHELLRRCRVSPKATSINISNEEIRDMCHVYEELCQQVSGLFFYDYRKPVPLEELRSKSLLYPPKYEFASEYKERF